MRATAGIGLIMAIVVIYLPAKGFTAEHGFRAHNAEETSPIRKARASESFPVDQPQGPEEEEGLQHSEVQDDKSEMNTQLGSSPVAQSLRYRLFAPAVWDGGDSGRLGGFFPSLGKNSMLRQFPEYRSPAFVSFMRRVGKADSNFIRFGRSFPYTMEPGNTKKNNFIRLGRENPRQTNFIRLGRSSLWKQSDRILPTVGFFPEDLYYSSAGTHWTPSFELPTSSELRQTESQ